MEQITICKECEFAERVESGDPDGLCLNTDAPVSEYVHGIKQCAFINNGHCEFFKVYTGAT